MLVKMVVDEEIGDTDWDWEGEWIRKNEWEVRIGEELCISLVD
jgi:hypothetical protein